MANRESLPPTAVAHAIASSAEKHGVSADLLRAVAWQESRFRQRAVSRAGAVGVMQLTPLTARHLGVNPKDLRANIDGGARYLASLLRRFGDVKLALAAYNAAPTVVQRLGKVPPYRETQQYVAAIVASLPAQDAAEG